MNLHCDEIHFASIANAKAHICKKVELNCNVRDSRNINTIQI